MAKYKVTKDKTVRKCWTRDVFLILFTVVITVVFTLIGDDLYERIRENQTREEIARMICFEVQNNIMNIDDFLCAFPREKTIESGDYSKVYINSINYDTRLYEEYMQKIPMLNHEEVVKILSFYGDIRKANETMQKLQDKDLDKRENWLIYFYQRLDEAYKKGKEIITALERQYEIKSLGDINDHNIRISQATSTISDINISTPAILIDTNDN